jgi:hypothetical protein
MKTYDHFYEQIYDFENLYWAYRAARCGKRGKAPVADFIRRQEDELLALQRELREESYQPGPYHTFYIHQPKLRLIAAAPFRDRVVHHALCNHITPIWENLFIADSYANRVGKGTHRAIDRCQQFARRYKYVLQCDLRQFFPSIDHALLLAVLSRRIRDERVLALCRKILASGLSVRPDDYEMAWFPGDDLFSALRPRGLPIGNLTSQFWANVYLNDFDHFIKRELSVPAYLRFVDDFLLFGNDKSCLHDWRQAVIERLAVLRLKLHENRAQVFPCETGIPFLGFRVYPTHRLVKRRNAINFRRRIRPWVQIAGQSAAATAALDVRVRAWINHVRYADSWGLRRAVLHEIRITR